MNVIPKTSVAVFGSSQASSESPHYRLAGELGAALARRGAEVRCGGYGGVMAAVSASAEAAGGKVVGCTLQWFGETRVPGAHLSEIEEAPDLHERIECLLRGVSGVVVLPGGVGTMNELFWVWSLLLFDRDPAPESLVLLGEPWAEMLGTLSRLFEFTAPILELVRVADNAEEAAEIACGGGGAI
jgi:uncharacterized protein (TIGR00730 family)